MYAIFENGGKQYKACVGDLVKVEKLNRKTGETVEFPVILTADEKGIKVSGDAAGLKVKAEVVSEGKDKKIIVFKYKPKKNERKKQGHRQPYSIIKVTAIGGAAEKPAAKKPAAKKTTTGTTEKKPAAKKTAAKKAEAETEAKAE